MASPTDPRARTRLVIKSWYADALKTKIRKTTARLMNESAQAGLEHSQSVAPVLTGAMRDDLRITTLATSEDLTVAFGSKDVDYTFWVEIGSQGRPGRYFLREGHQVAVNEFTQRLGKTNL